MKTLMSALMAALMLATSGCAGGEHGLPLVATTAPAPYQLGPGDQIRLRVYGLDMMTDSYLVSDTGTISIPMIGSVAASGQTVETFENSVAQTIRAKQLLLDPKVSAQIVAYRPFFITGEVQKPGQYPYLPGMSVMTAVSVAGGYTFRANTKGAIITRNSNKAAAMPESGVQPGDLIQIRESWF